MGIFQSDEQRQLDQKYQKRKGFWGSLGGNILQGVTFGLYDPNASSEADSEADDRRHQLDDLGNKLSHLQDDPGVKKRAGELYAGEAQDIDKGMYGASEGLAAAYARRGLGNSGASAAGQQQALQTAAAQRGAARMSSIRDAVGEARRGILDQAGIMGEGMNLDLARAARMRDSNSEFGKLLARGAGYALGGPAGGAAVGSALGGDAGGAALMSGGMSGAVNGAAGGYGGAYVGAGAGGAGGLGEDLGASSALQARIAAGVVDPDEFLYY